MDYADRLDLMDDDCDIQGFPLDEHAKHITNYDRIRAMSAEEMAEFFFLFMDSAKKAKCFSEGIFPYRPCPELKPEWDKSTICLRCGLDWLNSHAEPKEDKHENT